jgi:hypothetical protein
MKTYTLQTPITLNVGSQASVKSLQLASVSFNFENAYAGKGKAVLSVVLEDPATGYKQNIVYEDDSALALWQRLETSIESAVFAKLTADNKLPAGTVS